MFILRSKAQELLRLEQYAHQGKDRMIRHLQASLSLSRLHCKNAEGVIEKLREDNERLREELVRAEIQADYETETAHAALEEVKRLRGLMTAAVVEIEDGSPQHALVILTGADNG